MAINPSTKYPGQIDTTDPTGYPNGKAQDVITTGDGSGTPLQKDWVNDLWGFFQQLLGVVSATPTGTPDKVGASQYYDALETIYGDRLRQVEAERAFHAADYTTNPQPFSFGTSPQTKNIVYLPGQARWYSGTRDTSGSNTYVYDSVDGITWSAVTTLNTTQGEIIFIEQGGDLYCGSGDEIYKSTTGLVVNLVAQSPVFPNLTIMYGLVYDATNSLFIAVGSDGVGRAEIETAATVTGTWTNRKDVASSTYTGIATDGAGTSVVINSAVSSFDYSIDGGVSWTANATPTGIPVRVYWSDNLGRFAMKTSAATDYFMMTTDGTDFYERTVADDIWVMVPIPQGVLVAYDADGDDRMKWEIWSGIHALAVSQAYITEFNVNTQSAADILTLSVMDIQHAPDRWVFPYDSTANPKLAIFEY